jgi:UDP-N-acetylglucosamine 2-epimerase (non-hydrolysing)
MRSSVGWTVSSGTDPVMTERPRVLIVIGTRPEGIKLAPVVRALDARNAEVETRLALTGQHTDLMDQVLEVFSLVPSWDLGIMREGQDLYDVAHGCLDGLRRVFAEWRPDLVLAEGDTASVFLAGLVSFLERARMGHVEAGLRSRDRWRPWPEEIFRRLAGVIADLHFAPTHAARDNLLGEGIGRETVPYARVHVTGNTVVDAVRWAATLNRPVRNRDLAAVLAAGQRLVLVTAHRRESFGEPLRQALSGVRALADHVEDTLFIYPVHPNPNVRVATAVLTDHPRIRLTTPLDYLDLVAALRACSLVITDSGGLQEEAPALGKHVLVLRDVTERPEAVHSGWAELVGTDPAAIVARGIALLEKVARPAGPNPYGDGRAGERIADIAIAELTGATRLTTDWDGVA